MPSSQTAETTRLRKSPDKGPIPRRLRFGAPQKSHFQCVGNADRFNPAGKRSSVPIQKMGRLSFRRGKCDGDTPWDSVAATQVGTRSRIKSGCRGVYHAASAWGQPRLRHYAARRASVTSSCIRGRRLPAIWSRRRFQIVSGPMDATGRMMFSSAENRRAPLRDCGVRRTKFPRRG